MTEEISSLIMIRPEKYDIVQIHPSHKWGGCFAIIDEVKDWGYLVFVSIPKNDGDPPGLAFILLQHDEFELVGVKAYIRSRG